MKKDKAKKLILALNDNNSGNKDVLRGCNIVVNLLFRGIISWNIIIHFGKYRKDLTYL